jgi:hypothetical protein
MLRTGFHIVPCISYMYKHILNVSLPRFRCAQSPSYNRSTYFSDVLVMELWLDSSLSRFLHKQQGLIRKTARRGKRWLSNWRYVRRGQPSVNFEIRAL